MILLGKPVAEAIEDKSKLEIKELVKKNIKPHLAVILVGDDPASLIYVKKKQEKAESLGISFKLYHFPAIATEQTILDLIVELNGNQNIHGIIVQLPLPTNLGPDKILKSILLQKDVDGLNGGCMPPAAGAVLEILDYYNILDISARSHNILDISARSHNIDIKNKKVVLVGCGKLVGAPLAKIFSDMNLDLTVCDSKTLNLKPITSVADIIISGVGKPGLITADMVEPDAIVIDAGTAESSGSTVGDVDKSVYEKVSSYSPVPGGVGPITVIKLLKNVIEAAKKSVEN